MALYLTRTFQKIFEGLPEGMQTRVKESLKQIHKDPYSGKKLKGALNGEWSFRIGNYRIIYFIDDSKNIWLETIRHRKNAYEKK